MLVFFLRRLAFFIPTLLVISALIFGLSKQSAGDPVLNTLSERDESSFTNSLSDDLYISVAKDLGLDKPTFYFTLTSQAFPQDFYAIVKKDQRTALENLVKKYGNWVEISTFHKSIKEVLRNLPNPDSFGFSNNLQQVLIEDDEDKIAFLLEELNETALKTGFFTGEMKILEENYQSIIDKPTRSRLFFPVFYWYGFDNQYHHWISKFFKGNFGKAKDGRTVAQKLSIPLSITLFMSIPAIVLAYLIGVPLGIFTAANRQKHSGKWLMKTIFALYSLPTFWIALMAIRFLTSPQYGFNIFPSAGLSDLYSAFSVPKYLLLNIPRFILPILCMIIHPIAYIARLTQGAIIDNLSLDYVRTARAKGQTQGQILRKQILKNALFPLITLLGTMLPLLIGGSFIIEFVFNIKGMGCVAFDAIGEKDWQVVYTVLMFSAIMVLLGALISDILYKWANPRIIIK
jgi:peptide/nickel transport system permease protein